MLKQVRTSKISESEIGTEDKKSVDTEWEVNTPEQHVDRLKLLSKTIQTLVS